MTGIAKNLLKWMLPSSVWERFRAEWWRYLRPLIVDYCPIQMPWFPSARYVDPTAKLQQMAYQFSWHGKWSPTIVLAMIVATLTWPARAGVEILTSLYKSCRYIRRDYSIGYWRQFNDMIRLTFRDNVPARYYYRFRLFERSNAERSRFYFFESQMSVLYPILAANRRSDAMARLKHSFFEACRTYGLPTAETIAVFDGGKLAAWYREQSHQLPPTDIVLKPVDLACGIGFELFEYRTDTQTWHRSDLTFDEQAMMLHATNKSQGHRHILQVRLKNHEVLESICGPGLSTIRIVTCRDQSLNCRVLFACLRMPMRKMLVDNFEAGGIAAPIGLADGILGTAVAKDPRRGKFEVHPDTGAMISGTYIPFFAEAISLVKDAHSRFAWMPFVGWDVVITSQGPILLEANPDWGVELAQIAVNRPLGQTCYPELFLEQLTTVGTDVSSETAALSHARETF